MMSTADFGDWTRDDRHRLAEDLWSAVAPKTPDTKAPPTAAEQESVLAEIDRLRPVIRFVRRVLQDDYDTDAGQQWRDVIAQLEDVLFHRQPQQPRVSPPVNKIEEDSVTKAIRRSRPWV
jgi:hypothetical protein